MTHNRLKLRAGNFTDVGGLINQQGLSPKSIISFAWVTFGNEDRPVSPSAIIMFVSIMLLKKHTAQIHVSTKVKWKTNKPINDIKVWETNNRPKDYVWQSKFPSEFDHKDFLYP